MGKEISIDEILKLPAYLNEHKAKQKLIEYLRSFASDDLLQIATFCYMGIEKRCCAKKDDDTYKNAEKFVKDFVVFNTYQKTETSVLERLVEHLSGPCVITKYLYDYFETRYENPFKGLK